MVSKGGNLIVSSPSPTRTDKHSLYLVPVQGESGTVPARLCPCGRRGWSEFRAGRLGSPSRAWKRVWHACYIGLLMRQSLARVEEGDKRCPGTASAAQCPPGAPS